MRPRRILVVDDDPMVCETIEMMLCVDGHQVTTATTGKKALATFDKEEFDLVITDFALQEMSGHHLASVMKSRSPNLPVIMITAYADMLAGERLIPSVDLLLRKPCTLNKLREALGKVLPQ